jgi:hypothetical protein
MFPFFGSNCAAIPLLAVIAGGVAFFPFTCSDSVRVVTAVAVKDLIWFSAPYSSVIPSPSRCRFFWPADWKEVYRAPRFCLDPLDLLAAGAHVHGDHFAAKEPRVGWCDLRLQDWARLHDSIARRGCFLQLRLVARKLEVQIEAVRRDCRLSRWARWTPAGHCHRR